LAKSLVSSRKLAKAARSKYGGVRSLEALVDDESTVVDEAVIVDGQEHVLVNISVPCSNEYLALDLELVLLSLLLLLDQVCLLLAFLFGLAILFSSSSSSAAHI